MPKQIKNKGNKNFNHDTKNKKNVEVSDKNKLNKKEKKTFEHAKGDVLKVDTKSNEKPNLALNSPVPDVLPEIREPSKYKKRTITTNWDRYNEPVEEIDTPNEDRANFALFSGNQATSYSYFRFKDEKDWMQDTSDISLTIDCESLASSLKLIPICKRLEIPSDIIPPDLQDKPKSRDKLEKTTFIPVYLNSKCVKKLPKEESLDLKLCLPFVKKASGINVSSSVDHLFNSLVDYESETPSLQKSPPKNLVYTSASSQQQKKLIQPEIKAPSVVHSESIDHSIGDSVYNKILEINKNFKEETLNSLSSSSTSSIHLSLPFPPYNPNKKVFKRSNMNSPSKDEEDDDLNTLLNQSKLKEKQIGVTKKTILNSWLDTVNQ